MEGVMAVVTCFAADFTPKNWQQCNGQILAISTNTALFSLLGTTYGGNGVNTFALPDMRGRTQISAGTGPGLPNYTLGEPVGAQSTTLTINNLPSHTHNGPVSITLQGDNTAPDSADPANEVPSTFTGMYATAGTTVPMQQPTYSAVIGIAGSNQPVSILEPYLTINYIICMYGIFPSRN